MAGEDGAEAPCRLLLDTNVWLDYYGPSRSGHAAAMKLIADAIASGAELLYAITSSKDLFYLIAAGLKRQYRDEHDGALTDGAARAAQEVAWGCLGHMNEVATPVGCDMLDVQLARKQRRLHGDYEDDLVIAAVMRSQRCLLVTRDEGLLRHAPVAALSVPDALIHVESLGAA